MKKLFIAALLVAAIGSSAFAADTKALSLKVKTNFEAQFSEAQNVVWSVGEKFTKATFELNDEKIEAYYSPDGETIGYIRDFDFKKLPLNAIQKIKKDFATYKVTETIEFTQDTEKNFYVSLQDGNKKQILEVTPLGGVSKYNGTRY